MNDYSGYLNERKAISFEEMQFLHEQILDELGSDLDAQELYREFLKVSIRYGVIRAEWPMLSMDEKVERDSDRTSCHDSVIIHMNMLARYLKKQEKAVVWRDRLGYEENDPDNRKVIGDFACYLAFVNGLNAR